MLDFLSDVFGGIEANVAISLASLLFTGAAVLFAALTLKHAKQSEERDRVAAVLAEIVTAAESVVAHMEARPSLRIRSGGHYEREKELAEDSFRTFRNQSMRYRLMRGTVGEVDEWILDVGNNLIESYLKQDDDDAQAAWPSRGVVSGIEADLPRSERAPEGLPRLGAWWDERVGQGDGVYAAEMVWEYQIGRLLKDYIESYLVPYGRWVLHGREPEVPSATPNRAAAGIAS
ncbi:hypothetical protein SAMN05660662_3051 [Blastococcus aurantiacus]|uniref:DUF4760 domain-containing protein n=1 Tax=Blastococcus aurantiacus TaxID=1550231 RepID=A0A1G7N408_9ACTN|nr:hypothetical protein [Blastococcus aurantiacus]SDF68089.1 hypothetical protein SAMN05660662_3051 [Blastococcus aurantiacus]